MNVYDFDGTIYAGDSTVDFYFFCLKRYPIILLCLPKQIKGFLQYKFSKISKTELKEFFFCFLEKIDNLDAAIYDFWDINEMKIQGWYLDKKQDNDVIISASPFFLLKEICNRLNIKNLIASDVNPNTGEFIGHNCYGREKVVRYRNVFGDVKINCFYSDSKSDRPMADLAEKAFIVHGTKIKSWK